MKPSETRPLPRITAFSRPFWDGCAAGELRVQRCRDCGAAQLPPLARCRACGGEALAWQAVEARGELHSFTVVHRAPSDAFRAGVPYVLALVDIAPGARLLMHVTGCDPQAVAIGMALEIGFEHRDDGEATAWLPVARPAGDGDG